MRKFFLIILFLLFPSPVFSGGFEYPDNGVRALGRGGAFVVKSDDLTAIHFNPAGLIKSKGTHLLFSSNLTDHDILFKRMDSQGKIYDPIHNTAGIYFAPFVVISSDFGLENTIFAFGVYGPSAVGKLSFPENGAQKYNLINWETTIGYWTFSAAHKLNDKFSFGISFQFPHVISASSSQIVNGTFMPKESPKEGPNDTLTKLNYKDTPKFTMIIGALYRPVKYLELGMAIRPIPVYFNSKGEFEFEYLSGTLKSLDETGRIWFTDNDFRVTFLTPFQARGGIRYIYEKAEEEIFDIEFDIFYEMWSSLKKNEFTFEGEIGIKGEDKTEYLPIHKIEIPRKYKDTFSFRLGGDINIFHPYLKISVGGFYETPSSPHSTTKIDFLNFQRLGLGGGLTFEISAFKLSASYLHIFQPSRTVKPGESELYQLTPLSPCQPPYDDEKKCYEKGKPPGTEIGAGYYKADYDIFSFGVDVNFLKIF